MESESTIKEEEIVVTLVIPTRNHPDHLKRMVTYYEKCKVTYFFIIVDSSSKQNEKRNVQILKDSNLKYEYMGGFAEETYYPIKVREALNRVKTPYVLLGADDDFLIPEAIDKCCIFLEQNSDYVFAQGAHYGFTYDGKSKSPDFFVLDVLYGMRSIVENSSCERLCNILTHYLSAFYAVFRLETLKYVLDESITYSTDYKFLECVMEAVAAISSKFAFIDTPYCVRELSDDSTGASKDSNWIESVDFKERLCMFKECLKKNLKQQIDVDLEKKVNSMVEQFVLYQKTLFYNAFQIQPSRARNLAKKFLPALLYEPLIFLKRYFSYEWPKRKIGLKYTLPLRNKNSYARAHFIFIRDLIKQSGLICSRQGVDDIPKIESF